MTTRRSKLQPTRFGGYLLFDRIAIGGMAEVWRAKMFSDEGDGRLVALKRILPTLAMDEEFRAMFADEGQLGLHLIHSNIAQIYEAEEVDRIPYLAMEYIPGKPLSALYEHGRKTGEPAPLPLACHCIAKAAEGLDYAHRKKDGQGRDLNIVHRGLSLGDVLISYAGEVKVIDFGIAKAAGRANQTQPGIIKGRFGYMSPEQVRGTPLDGRSDIFNLGVCLYELLTGERAFEGGHDFATLEKVQKAEVVPPSRYNRRIPEELERIVLKALARDVEDRYSHASALGHDLQRFLVLGDSGFYREDLMRYMRSTFAEDFYEEEQRQQEYARIQPPEDFNLR